VGKFVLKNADVIVNGQNISNWVREVAVETERDVVEVTGMQAANKEKAAGLGDGRMTMEVLQDFALGAIDALLWPLSTTDTPFVVAVKAQNAAKAPTNPSYEMSALLFNYSPIQGAVGDAATTPVTFENAAPAGISRVTS